MDYYVDNSVSKSGTGSSWSSAWRNFSDINWSIIKPGDIIYVSGGSTSQTYDSSLYIGTSGSAAASVTITKGTDPGHNGTVIIDGQNNLANGVYDVGYNYVTVSDLNVQNITDSGFEVKDITADVLIENNSVYSGMGLGNGADARGYDVRDSVGQNGQYAVIIKNNSFTTPASTTSQTDGIWSSGNNGVLFQGNNINIANSDPTGHSDGIQSYEDTNITIAGNYISHPNGGLNNHGMWITDIATGGTVNVYNNVVSMPVGDEIAIAAWNQTAGWNGAANIVNNTAYGGYDDYFLENSPLSVLKDNIAVPAASRTGVFLAGSTPPAANTDNNLIWAPSATVATINNVKDTWAQWQASGYDKHGVNADPLFVNAAANNFALQSNSPAIGAGASFLGVTTDYQGVVRPQGSGDDIGAYQGGTSTSTPTPYPTPTPATVINVPAQQANETVSVNQATINAGTGNHTFFISGSHDTFNLAGGTETITDNGGGSNTFNLPAAGNGRAIFNAAALTNGDTFNISAALKATSWDGSMSTLGSYLHTHNSGGTTQLLVSAIATSRTSGIQLETFNNIHASLATILSHATV